MVERVVSGKSSSEDMLPYQLMTKIKDDSVHTKIALSNDDYLVQYYAISDSPELFWALAEQLPITKVIHFASELI
jgi:hypothetical protein